MEASADYGWAMPVRKMRVREGDLQLLLIQETEEVEMEKVAQVVES